AGFGRPGWHVGAGPLAAGDVAGLAERAGPRRAADTVEARQPLQTVGRGAAGLTLSPVSSAQVGLRIADVGQEAVCVGLAGRVAGGRAVALVGCAGDGRRRLARSAAVAGPGVGLGGRARRAGCRHADRAGRIALAGAVPVADAVRSAGG